ncbi:MAG TPA: methylated-DNA--[protein]-cysteine S-methyltransferase [Candidatus Babeliales bacterium]|nr:methylated-DNA--[protein]-cysteine S-methyltransferase [Candidatus Babeliales bacterium]
MDKKQTTLYSETLQTPLGVMIAIADEHDLYLLEFTDNKKLDQKIKKLTKETEGTIAPGISAPLQSIQQELVAYFAGTLTSFKTPLKLSGTEFQKTAWKELLKIPYGKTTSYAQQAIAIQKETAYRAVANANGANRLAIIIPCHRIITSANTLGGYGGGIARKQWLIEHEKNTIVKQTQPLLTL